MDESPMPSRTSRRSSYSLYQSDYETAAEDSDGSLYYSLLDGDETDNEEKENRLMSPRLTSVSSRHGQSLLQKCLQQKNLNLTPRNKYNKRVSFNVNPSLPTSMNSECHGRLMGTYAFETGNEVTKKSKNDESSNLPDFSTSTENINEIFSLLKTSTANDSDIVVEVGEEDKSLNDTIIERAANAVETITEVSAETIHEAPKEEALVGAVAVASSSTVNFNLKTTNIPCGPTRIGLASSRQSISTTFGLSNLPVPKKIAIADLADPLPTSNNSHVPSSKRLSPLRGRSTENYGFSRPNGKSGIPRVSLVLARNNSVLHASAMPSSSSQCKYCDKTFAKQSILDVHLLEKCEKIPPARYRQLERQQSLRH